MSSSNTALTVPSGQNDLAKYMRELANHDVLEREEEERLAYLYYETGDVDAARRLVLSHLRFVVKVAFGYKRYGLPMMEIIQEGNLGLMEAVRKFNPNKGYRLITYAVWWIRAYIQRYILDMWSVVRRGTTRAQRKLFYNLQKTTNQLAQSEGRELKAGEIAEALDVEESDVQAMQQMMRGADVSLDQTLGDDGDSYIDFLADSSDSQEQQYIANEEVVQVRDAVDTVRSVLNDRDRDILERRLLAEDPATLEELSKDYSISRERVRQLESNIKKKIKGLLPAPEDDDF
jgi:RNA polymerase sigma-32 factor